jgi:hypothetical protein
MSIEQNSVKTLPQTVGSIIPERGFECVGLTGGQHRLQGQMRVAQLLGQELPKMQPQEQLHVTIYSL